MRPLAAYGHGQDEDTDRMLIANPMTPPRYPGSGRRDSHPGGGAQRNSAACRLTPLARTGRPAGSDPAVNTRRTSRHLTLLRSISRRAAARSGAPPTASLGPSASASAALARLPCEPLPAPKLVALEE